MTSRHFKKLSHSLYECKYHIVFCPKYRYKILDGEVKAYLIKLLYRLCEQKSGIEIIEINVQADHVHIIMSIPPKYAISDVMGFLKGKTALKMFDKFPHLRKKYWGQHFWSRGYCVSSIGLDEERIRKYVKWQNKNDKNSDGYQGRLFD